MNDCDALLKEVMTQARQLGIPISAKIEPRVVVNRRAVTRFGCCKYVGDKCIIEVADRVAEGPEQSCRETLAHEVLHTCYGCRNHGKRWRGYAERMNQAYGYNISRASTAEKLGVKETNPCKYLLRCQSCGAEYRRYRASPLTRYPERDRCKCGGRLKLI